jgi:two-component system, cell cycle response regulator DivK
MPKRVLIVEDTEDNRRIMRIVLTGAGFEVIEAKDGVSGVEAAEKHKPDLHSAC